MEQAGCALRFRSASRALRYGGKARKFVSREPKAAVGQHAKARRAGPNTPRLPLYFLRNAGVSGVEMRCAQLLSASLRLCVNQLSGAPRTPAYRVNPKGYTRPPGVSTLSPVQVPAFSENRRFFTPRSPFYSNPLPGQSRSAPPPQRATPPPTGARPSRPRGLRC